MNSKTPRIIHFIWLQGIQAGDFEPFYASNIASWKRHNPGWDVMFWDKGKIFEYLIQNYPDWAALWLELDKPIKQCDMARYLILHGIGGIYSDVDVTCVQPIDTLAKSNEIRLRKWNKFEQPTFADFSNAEKEKFDSEKYDIFFTRENFLVDKQGYAVSNAIISSVPKNDFWIKLVEHCLQYKDGLVLDSFGTWRLARFLRKLENKSESRIIILPPYYFLWEETVMGKELLPITISKHLYKTTWGDPTKDKPWMV